MVKKSVTVIGLLLALVASTGACSPAAKKESGYLLEQYSDYWGPQTTYVTDSGLWIHSPKLELTMFMHAPDWKVCCYNSRNKTYITCGHKEWAQKFVGPIGERDPEYSVIDANVQKIRARMHKGIMPKCGDIVSPSISVGRTGEICGRKALQIFMTGHVSSLFPPYAKTIEFWVVPELNFNKRMIEAVSETDGLPQCVGLPIDLFRHNGRGKTLTQYKTNKIQNVMVDESLFKLPSGYTLAEDEMSLVTTAASGDGKADGLSAVFGDELGDLDGLDEKKPSPPALKKQLPTVPK